MRTTEFSSFRDPSGVVFKQNGTLYRQINKCYQKQFDTLIESGLYGHLVEKHLLISHADFASDDMPADAVRIICPVRVPFISYPYEWSFGQLKDAALTTLKIQRQAIDYSMILKDASAYNIQFVGGSAILIDTLSFDYYEEGRPWIAYGQFCRHFMAPLLLMAYTDIRLSQLLRIYIDGIPLDLASKLLKGKGGLTAKQHIHWHARLSSKHAEDGKKAGVLKIYNIKKFSYIAMIDSMIRAVEKLELKGIQTEWGEYYEHSNYTDEASKNKAHIVTGFLEEANPQIVWDFGANDGRYSRIASKLGAEVVAFDIDPIAVERNYQAVKGSGMNFLPLIMDLTNPSPAIGFANRERPTVFDRQKADCIMALAVIHHLAISNNLPLAKIADWFSEICEYLIIEFVPKDDSQVKTLLATREDIFPEYTKEGFEKTFAECFTLVAATSVAESLRTMYLYKSHR